MIRPAGKKQAPRPPAPSLRRRELVRFLAALYLATACGPAVREGREGSTAPPAPSKAPLPLRARPTPAKPFGGPVVVHSWFDFPDDPRSRELSGIAWDDATQTLWAVQDETANIVPLLPDRDLKTWGFGPVIQLEMTFPLDLEGIVVVPDGFIVASEKGPRILEVDRQGRLRRDIPLPEHFAKARDNKSIESLTMDPSGAHLFTTTEAALTCDGAKPTLREGSRLRILRMTRSGTDAEEHAYMTDPLPHDDGDWGVADLAALGDDDMLVLERGWARGAGNTARVYRVSLSDPTTSCIGAPVLAENARVLKKELLVDLGKLKAKGLPATKQIQASPLLDNYEGMAVGPVLPDGRRTLILVSDDNNRSDQFARIVVLAVG